MNLKLQRHQASWAEQYALERQRLLNSLGFCTDNGAIYRLEHIGSTSIAALPAQACIDIIIDAYPMPLSKEQLNSLGAIGYHLDEKESDDGRQMFQHEGGQFYLYCLAFEEGYWPDYLLFRNFLQGNQQTRLAYAQLKLELAELQDLEAYQKGKLAFFKKVLAKAHAWHIQETAFKPLEKLARMMAGLPCLWAISSGWALDLFAAKASRYHDDLDIVVARADQLLLQKHLLERGWQLHKPIKGVYSVWEPGEFIPEPNHQIHARKEGDFIDILLEPREGDSWLYRRLSEIRMSLSQAYRYHKGIPYLAPELVLLFKSYSSQGKAGNPRSKDQLDFERMLPLLSSSGKAWLKKAIQQWRPEHVWLEQL